MSWGYEFTGQKNAVLAAVAKQTESSSKNYEGKPEAADIRAIGTRIKESIEALSPDYNAVSAKANGSHCTLGNGYIGNANASFSVVGMKLLLDEPPAT